MLSFARKRKFLRTGSEAIARMNRMIKREEHSSRGRQIYAFAKKDRRNDEKI